MQTLKDLRSNLNRWFKDKRDIDIVEDVRFTKANNVFKGAKVRAKKSGKGVTKSTLAIGEEDMEQLAMYFHIDHFLRPKPKGFTAERNVQHDLLSVPPRTRELI